MMWTKKRAGIIGAVFLMLVTTLGLWMYLNGGDQTAASGRHGEKPQNGGPPANRQTDEGEAEKKADIEDPNDSPGLLEMTFRDFQPIPRHWTQRHSFSFFKNTRLRVLDMVGRRACPAIDLHFRKPGPGGVMRPASIEQITFWPIDPETKKRLKRIKHGELEDIGFQDRPSWIRYSLFEGTEPDVSFALKLGRTYYIQMWEDRWFDLEEERRRGLTGRGSVILTIPEEVPEGKVLVVKLDVTATDDEWRITEEMVPKEVTMKMPDYPNRSIAYFHYNPENKCLYPSRIIRDKTVTWSPSSMKEEIGIFDTDQRYRLMYRGDLKEKLEFPRDATEVVEAEDVTRFQVRAPKDVPEDTMSLCLLKGGEEHVPVALGPDSKDIAGRKMDFHAPPGTYYVAYVIQEVGFAMKPFGTVTVPELADGKVLDIQPER